MGMRGQFFQLKYGDSEQAVETRPTIGYNVEEIHFGRLVMTLWDLGGQNKLRGLWSEYYGMLTANAMSKKSFKK